MLMLTLNGDGDGDGDGDARIVQYSNGYNGYDGR